MAEELKIGSKVWVEDPHRRVYRRDANGQPCGGPLPEGRFVESEIVKETPRKWVALHGQQAKKKKPYETGFFTRQQVDAIVWRETHQYRILGFIEGLLRQKKITNDQLRQIAEIVGYDFNRRED